MAPRVQSGCQCGQSGAVFETGVISRSKTSGLQHTCMIFGIQGSNRDIYKGYILPPMSVVASSINFRRTGNTCKSSLSTLPCHSHSHFRQIYVHACFKIVRCQTQTLVVISKSLLAGPPSRSAQLRKVTVT